MSCGKNLLARARVADELAKYCRFLAEKAGAFGWDTSERGAAYSAVVTLFYYGKGDKAESALELARLLGGEWVVERGGGWRRRGNTKVALHGVWVGEACEGKAVYEVVGRVNLKTGEIEEVRDGK